MAANKRYYWIKQKEEFFTDKRIKRLRRISGEDTYTIIYLKLLLLSLKDDGKETVAAIDQEDVEIDFSKVQIEDIYEDVDFDTFSKSDFRAVKVKDCVEVPKSKKLLQFTLDDGTGEDRTILSGIKAYYNPEDLVGRTLLAIVNLPPRKMMGVESQGMLLSAVHEEEGEEKLNLIILSNRITAGAKLY